MPVQMDYTGFSTNATNPRASGDDFIVGDTVYVNGEGDWRGKILFLGETDFAKGEWAGIVLDHPLGSNHNNDYDKRNHDGVARGKRYFQCSPGHGIFVRVKRLSKKVLVPETFDPEKIGLYRERETPPRYFRETSPVSSIHSSSTYAFSKSPSRESSPRLSSPGGTRMRSVSFSREREMSPGPQYHNNHHQSKPLKMGERVIVASSVGETKTGILRYLGPTEFAEGEWAGIELFHPLGKNDGTVRGRQYFRCEHPFGLFVPSHKVETSPANKTLGKRMGTRENLYAVMSTSKNGRAGSYDDYY